MMQNRNACRNALMTRVDEFANLNPEPVSRLRAISGAAMSLHLPVKAWKISPCVIAYSAQAA